VPSNARRGWPGVASIPLLLGLTAYRGFYQLATQNVVDGLVTITLALAIGLALAAGVALGDFIARPRATQGGGRSTACERPDPPTTSVRPPEARRLDPSAPWSNGAPAAKAASLASNAASAGTAPASRA
jgi:hypothetical protein